MATNTPLVPTRPGSGFCVFVWDLVLIGYFWALLSNFWAFFLHKPLKLCSDNYFIFNLLVKKKTEYSFCEARNISFGFAIMELPETNSPKRCVLFVQHIYNVTCDLDSFQSHLAVVFFNSAEH